MTKAEKKELQLSAELFSSLRAEYEQYQAKAHLEDRMSFIDYAQGLGRFQGYKIVVKTNGYLDYMITFTK